MFDRLLIKPTALELSAALVEAGGGDRAFWEAQVAPLREERAGRRDWLERRVRIAWWTDHHNRRHFRVVRETDTLFGPANRPAIADLYPDVCICRALGQEPPAWVLLCGCGTVLPADTQTGWMGPCCAACDGLAPAARPRHGRILDLGKGTGVVPLSDAFLVAGPDGVRFLDREAHLIRELKGVLVEPPLAVSPDRHHLVSFGGQRMRAHDLRTGELLVDQPDALATAVTFSPRGTAVAVTSSKRLTFYDFAPESGALTPRQGLMEGIPGFSQAAWSPDGRTLVLASIDEIRLWHGGREVPFNEGFIKPEPLPPPALAQRDEVLERWAASEPHRWVAATGALGGTRVWFTADGLSLLRARRDGRPGEACLVFTHWSGTPGQWRQTADRRIAETPTLRTAVYERWLAVDRGLVSVTDLETGDRLGQVGWPDSDARRPWFTPDGRSLVIAHAGHMKVVPWALLLGVPIAGG